MTKDEAFQVLAEQGVALVVMHFYGGGDEGFVDDIELRSADGIVIRTLEEYYEGGEWNPETRQWVIKDIPTADAALSQALVAPVYDRYGSFAGEFHVEGTVVWDVRRRSVKISGREWGYTPSVEDLEDRTARQEAAEKCHDFDEEVS